MIEPEQDHPADLQQAYSDLTHIKDALSGVETTMLAGLVGSLADTTEKLMAVTTELQTRMPDNWLDTEPAARHLGLSRSGLENSDCPRHYLTPKKPKWNVPEMDRWGLSK